MSKYFNYKALDQLRTDAESRAVAVTFDDDVSPLLQPLTVAGRAVGSRLAVHPMEGCDGTLEGAPGDLTFRRWERFGAGGAKIIWGEATAVVPEGRANPRQLLLNETTAPELERLLNQTRAAHRARFGRDEDLLVGLQLTHSGRWSYPNPIIARHSATIDPIKHTETTTLIDDTSLERLAEAYLRAAVTAHSLGFDFVDIKQCHTYLLNEILGARNRHGPYGGSFENRSRFVRELLERIRSDAPGLILATRLNVFDGPRYTGAPGEFGVPVPDPDNPGWGTSADGLPDPAEPLALIGLLRDLGVAMVNVTMGSPYFNPHIGRPFERAPVDGYQPPEHPLTGVERHFRLTAAVQQAYPELTVLGTGYSWLRHFAANAGAANVAAGRVSVMGLGRGALAYPDFAADLAEAGSMDLRKACIGVSYCTALMRAKNNELGQFAAGCVPRDPLYAQEFKLAQKAGS
ncbi:MAG TPA: NADH:flavin oxidoreductase [Dehalococcoidia bacterium]|nr:NADH:flavin oxidoreductase [Dehalococcoidia bacterium]